jgi:hypothetical protein
MTEVRDVRLTLKERIALHDLVVLVLKDPDFINDPTDYIAIERVRKKLRETFNT